MSQTLRSFQAAARAELGIDEETAKPASGKDLPGPETSS
jgi:hypothetical protein